MQVITNCSECVGRISASQCRPDPVFLVPIRTHHGPKRCRIREKHNVALPTARRTDKCTSSVKRRSRRDTRYPLAERWNRETAARGRRRYRRASRNSQRPQADPPPHIPRNVVSQARLRALTASAPACAELCAPMSDRQMHGGILLRAHRLMGQRPIEPVGGTA